MELRRVAHKKEPFDLNGLAYKKLKGLGIVSFRNITRILGVNFHLTRKETFQLLNSWQKKRWVKIYSYHGVEFVKKE